MASTSTSTRAARLGTPLIVLALLLSTMAVTPTLARRVGTHASRKAACHVSSRRHGSHRARRTRSCRKAACRFSSRRHGSDRARRTRSCRQAHRRRAAPAQRPTGAASAPRTYWGAAIGAQLTGSTPPWNWNAVAALQSADTGGKPLSILHWGSPFYSSLSCGGACSFSTSIYDKVRGNGVIPLLSWQSSSTDTTSGFSDAQIAAGSQDAYITQWAQAAKAWRHPFFLRFDWEMNGNWFPWGVGNNGNTVADYVAMWRHVHDIFTSVGATNATWVWCPNIDPTNSYPSLSGLYPGNAYVDWTCLDGYNGDDPWTSFHDLFSSTYNTITGTVAPSKPMIVGETGSTETGGSKAQWISNMFSALPTSFPKIRGLLWYDVSSFGPGGHSDWRLESSTASEAAFATGIQSPSYTTNTHGNLNTSPIPPPP